MAEVMSLTHDSNDWSEYTTAPSGGAQIALSASAGMAGTSYGVEFDPDATATTGGDKSVSVSGGATTYRFAFYINKNDVAQSTGGTDETQFCTLTPDTLSSTTAALKDSGSGEFVQIVAGDDTGDETLNTGVLPAGNNTVELEIVRAATNVSADGTAELFLNGSSQATASSIDNYDTFEDFKNAFTFNLVCNLSGTCTGTFYVDQIKIRDDATEIYPSDFTGYDLVLGGGQP